MTDGGLVIPQMLDEEMYDYWVTTEYPWPRSPRIPLTRWQRVRQSVRLIPHRIRWAIHDRLFSDCPGENDWDY